MRCKRLCITASRLCGIATGVHVPPRPVRLARAESSKVMERKWNGDASVNKVLERSHGGDVETRSKPRSCMTKTGKAAWLSSGASEQTASPRIESGVGIALQ